MVRSAARVASPSFLPEAWALSTTSAMVFAPGTMVETFDQDFPGGNPFDPAHRLRTERLNIAAGHAIAPDTPGLGFDLDWSLFR